MRLMSEYLTALWHWRKKSSKRRRNMEEVLLDMQSAAKQVAEDHTIQSLLAQLQVPEISEESVISALDARLKQIASMYAGLDGVYICLDDFTVAKSRYYTARDEHDTLLLTGDQYMVIRNHEDIQWIVSDEGSLVADQHGKRHFGCGQTAAAERHRPALRDCGGGGAAIVFEENP